MIDTGDIVAKLQAKHGTVLVVVGQPASVGALVARDTGCPVAYLPGLTMRRIADLYPGEAKTDAKDAGAGAAVAARGGADPAGAVRLPCPDLQGRQASAGHTVTAESAENGRAAGRGQSVELVVIKELLGHAHIGVTAGVYAHVRLRLRRQAIGTLGGALRRADDGNDGPPTAAVVR